MNILKDLADLESHAEAHRDMVYERDRMNVNALIRILTRDANSLLDHVRDGYRTLNASEINRIVEVSKTTSTNYGYGLSTGSVIKILDNILELVLIQ